MGRKELERMSKGAIEPVRSPSWKWWVTGLLLLALLLFVACLRLLIRLWLVTLLRLFP